MSRSQTIPCLLSAFTCCFPLACSSHEPAHAPPDAAASPPRVAVSIVPSIAELSPERADLQFMIQYGDLKIEGTADGRNFLRLGDNVSVELAGFRPPPGDHLDLMRRALMEMQISGAVGAVPDALKTKLAANDPDQRLRAQEAARQLILEQPAIFVGRTRAGEYISCALMMSSQQVQMLAQNGSR